MTESNEKKTHDLDEEGGETSSLKVTSERSVLQQQRCLCSKLPRGRRTVRYVTMYLSLQVY